jgi:hypothetical protein
MKKTDPNNLRKPAARLFISLLRDKDRAGIVSFSDSGEPLIGLAEVDIKQNRKRLLSALEKVSSSGKFTNIHDGVKKGYETLKAADAENKERVIILMSDGQMDLGSKEKEDALIYDMKTALLPEIKKAGIKIYTIAFTESSDRKLLEDIALNANGAYRLAKTDKDLHLIFTSIFEKIKSPDSLPIQGNSFHVDKDITELTLLITKKSHETGVVISDPSGRGHKAKKHSPDMQWFESKAFDMATITKPASGKWGIKFSSEEGNKVFVITNLKLLSSFNVNFADKGSTLKLDAWLEKGKEALKEKEILEHIKISAQVKSPDGKATALKLPDDGTNGDKTPGDGVYTSSFMVEQEGDYSIIMTADGETFKREKVYAFKAIKPQTPPQVKPPADVPAVEKAVEKKEDEISWVSVLVRFGVINIVIAVVTASAYFIRKIKRKKDK